MKKIAILTLLAAALCNADTLPQSGDVVRIGDFEYVIVSKSDFDRMWLTVSDLKHKLATIHSNETGRVALHGIRKHKTITNGVIRVEYADGFTYTQDVKESAIKPMNHPPTPPRRITEFEAKREAMRKRRQAKLSTTNEVTAIIKR